MNRIVRTGLAIALVLHLIGCSSPSPDDVIDDGRVVDGTPVTEDTLPAEIPSVDLSMYAVKYYPPGDPVENDVPILEDDRPFEITGFGPVDFLPAEVRAPSIFITFSQPVVPISMLGKPADYNEVMSIDPPLRGTYRWYGTRLLSFDSVDDALPQKVYTVKVNPSVLSLGGKSLTGSSEFTFRTEPLAIARVIPGVEIDFDASEVPPDAARNLTLVFNHEINVDVVTSYLEVRVDGVPVTFGFDREIPGELDFRPEELRRSVVLRVHDEVPEASDVAVVLIEGARSEAGYAGSPSEQIIDFSTIKKFLYVGHTTDSWMFPRSPEGNAFPVFLEFSHPLRDSDVASHLSTEPAVDIAPESVTVWGNQAMITDLPFPPESTYILIIDGALSDVYNRSLGDTIEIEVKVPEAPRYAYFPNTGSRMLEAQFPHRIAYEYQNVDDGVWKIDRIFDPYRSFDAEELEPYDFSGAERNIRNFEILDLDPWLNEEGKGMVGISWNFSEKDKKGNRSEWAQENLQLQITDLAVTSRIAYNRIVVLVSSLSTGVPVAGAEVAVMRGQEVKLRAETDVSGLAVFELEVGDYNRYFQDIEDTWRDHLRIRATFGLDSIEFVPNGSHNPYRSGIYSVSSPLYASAGRMEVLLFTDRGLYRPGEKVWFRGVDLDLKQGEYEGYLGRFAVELRESGYKGRVLETTRGGTTASGGLYGSFHLSDDIEPGYYVIAYTRADGREHLIYFQVANFKRLKFQVDIQKHDVTAFAGDVLEFPVHAEYLAGGNLSAAPYQFYWAKEPSAFHAPGPEWEDFRFGPLVDDERYFLSSHEGELDAGGNAVATQKTTTEGVAGMPYSYQLEARVQDAGRQEIAVRERVFVHPASYYIAARISSAAKGSWSTFVAKGDEVIIGWNLVKPDGRMLSETPQDRPVEAELYRVDWKVAQQQGVAGRITTRYEMIEELEARDIRSGAGGNGSFSFRPKKSGLYRVKLRTVDEDDRAIVTGLEFYSTGADWIRWGGDSDEIGLETDNSIYTPGETANILVKSPLQKGTYLVSIEREALFEQYLIELDGSAQIIGVPVRESHIPVVYVSIASYSVRTGAPSHTYFTPDLDKPKGYYGAVAVYVDTSSRRIDIDIDTEGMTYLPGGEAEITLLASSLGKPVAGAELTFLAVDRGVVDLIDYHVPDPLEYFYSPSRFPLAVRGADSRSVLIDPVTYEVRDLYGGDSADEKGSGGIRSNFVPTAVFEPFLITDRNGIATVKFTLPDTLTTYRCTAIAVDNGRFGYTEEELRVQQPVNIVSLVPERMRTRDTTVAGVIITNMDRTAHEVTVGVESDLLRVDGDSVKTLTVAPGETNEMTFTMYAEDEGAARVTFTTSSEVLNEKLVREVQVDKPTVRETVTTAGRADPDESGGATTTEGLVLPGYDTVINGSLILDMSPSLIAGLESSMEYLLQYPHGCFEQRAGKIMPLVLFGDMVKGLGTGEAARLIEEELRFWSRFQLEGGGFPFWPEAPVHESYYVSLRIAHIIKLAEERGFEIPVEIDIKRLLSYLAKPSDSLRGDDYLMLYSLYVQAIYGAPVRQQVADYEPQAGDLDLASLGLLGMIQGELELPEKAAETLRMIIRYVKPGTRTIDLTPIGGDRGAFYGREMERLALLLMLQVAVDPANDLTDRIAGTLLQRQYDRMWRNTASTNWLLLAMATLSEARGDSAAGGSATATLAGSEIERRTFAGPMDRARVELGLESEPLSSLGREVVIPLRLSTDGNRLYYTVSLAYDLPAETAGARDEGFTVYSTIETVDGTEHKSNILELGRSYRQRVVVSTSRQRSLVALRIPVPSGADILDTSFTTTGSYDDWKKTVDAPLYRPPPIEKIYDNEVRYYFDDMYPGSVEVVFIFRATSRGVYPTPPSTVECMYEPEVFGRSAGTLLIIRE